METGLLIFVVLQMMALFRNEPQKIMALIRNEPLTSERRYMALCLKSIIHGNFMPEETLLVSFPNNWCNGNTTLPKCHDVQLVDFVLENIHRDDLLSIHVHRPEDSSVQMTDDYLTMIDNYVIFTWPEEVHGDVIEALVSQIEDLMSVGSWNPRARFLVVVTESDTRPTQLLALMICETMWATSRIINVVIMVPNSDDLLIDGDIHNFDLYTWFPYTTSSCAEPRQVVRIDQCLPDNNRQPFSNKSLFPNKIPKNFRGCSIRVSAAEVKPYVILTNSYKNSDGNTVYNYRGLEIEYLLLLAEATNLTVVFLPPIEGDLTEKTVTGLEALSTGTSEVAIGHLPINLIMIPFADPTVTIIFDALRWHVPCPRPVSRMGKIMSAFTVSVWFNIAVVFILTVLIFWRLANVPYSHMVVTESQTYREIHRCLYIVWALSLGVSVPKKPRTLKLRAFFFLFLCYCFVVGTLFQATFISFLVNPGYHTAISNFEELVETGLPYGKIKELDRFLHLVDYYELDRFRSHFDCPDHHKCLQRLFVDGDATVFAPTVDATYVLSHMGTSQNRKPLCTLNDNVYPLDVAMYLAKGHPLLHLFNVVITRCIEAGLVLKYWSDTIFRIHLQHAADSKEPSCAVCNDMYFVFTLSHVKVAFVVLLGGFILSAIVFVIELVYKGRSEPHTVTVTRYFY